MKVVRIYMPKSDLEPDNTDQKQKHYGQVRRTTSKQEYNEVTTEYYDFFVINSTTPNCIPKCQLPLIGFCNCCKSVELGNDYFHRQSSSVSEFQVFIDDRQIIPHSIQLIWYDPEKFLESSIVHPSDELIANNSYVYLTQLLKEQDEIIITTRKKVTESFHTLSISIVSIVSKIIKPIAPIFEKTAVYRHCKTWNNILESSSGSGAIHLDVFMGILVFFLLNHIKNPGSHFMKLTEFIVNRLRSLLGMLDGSPVGLKLNVQLNNFLLSCFTYHVDLWWNFIVIVEPAIHYLFLPLTASGLMGISFQCAMLCDVITIITLHAHCFYIYAAMLYKLEFYSLKSLLRIVLGRRLNVLKGRIESQDYTNRQLFIATMLFTTLLFLLPTVITYYVVFALLRFFIYCITYVLLMIQRQILLFPFFSYLRWIIKSQFDILNLSIKIVKSSNWNAFDDIRHKPSNYATEYLEFSVHPNSLRPWEIYESQIKLPKPLHPISFARALFIGELMAFLPVEQSTKL